MYRGFFRNNINELLGIDLRSLAFFRIGLGLLLIGDLIIRASDLRTFYTDEGVLPRWALLEKFAEPWLHSIHLISGTAFVQGLLFLTAGIAALALLLGYRTRLATVLSWLLLVSLQARNPVVLQGGDLLFKMLLFWGMFLPLGARFSLDSWGAPPLKDPDRPAFSAATIALLLQVVFVYLFTVLLKSHDIWWREGSAVYYALNIDQLLAPLGRWLLQFPDLLRLLTFGTLALEIGGPILAFFPFATGPIRTLAVFLMILLHAGMGISLHLGPFPYISFVGWLAFLPSWFWEKPFTALMGLPPLPRIIGRMKQKLEEARRNHPSCFLWRQARPPSLGLSRGWQAFVAACLIYVTLWNVRTLDFSRFSRYFPRKWNFVGEFLRIDQFWNMFAPFPLKDDGWYVIPGKLKNGEQVDLFRHGAPVSWEKPADVAALYPNERWRKYMMNLWAQTHTQYRLYFGQYLCRTWNRSHFGQKQLDTFQIVYMQEFTQPPGESPNVVKSPIWDHQCFEKSK